MVYYHLLPIADVAASSVLTESFVDCFARVFTFSEVLAVATAVPFEKFKLFAAAFLQLAAAEKLSYVAVDGKEVWSTVSSMRCFTRKAEGPPHAAFPAGCSFFAA